MGNLCEKSNIAKINETETTILQCKITRDNIKVYLKKLEKSSDLKKEKAKEALKQKNKERARMYLRQAKVFSEQVKGTEMQLEMIEEQIAQIEIALNQSDAIKVLQQGNEILKQLHKEVNVEKFERIAEEMVELKDQQDEIAELFKQRGLNPEEEEEAINDELDKLMQNEGYVLDKELPDAEVRSFETEKKREKEKVVN